MKISKPSYYLKLTMEECPRLVFVNGIEIERDFSGETSHSEYPINHFIKNGINTLELAVGTDEFMKNNTDEDSECEVQVRVRGSIDGREVDFKVSNIKFEPDFDINTLERVASSMEPGHYQFSSENSLKKVEASADTSTKNIELGKNFLNGVGSTYVREFTAAVPFKEWAFFHAEKSFEMPIKDTESYDKYEKIAFDLEEDLWERFNSRDPDKILPAFSLRSKELDEAFYKTPGTTQSELKKSLDEVFREDLPLLPKDEENMQTLVSNDGRLITLVDAGNMSGTIYFRDEKSDSFTAYTVYWAKKDGKWFIAR